MDGRILTQNIDPGERAVPFAKSNFQGFELLVVQRLLADAGGATIRCDREGILKAELKGNCWISTSLTVTGRPERPPR